MNIEIIKSQKYLEENKPNQGDVITTYNAFHDELNSYMFIDDGYGNKGLVNLSNGLMVFYESDGYVDYSDLIDRIIELDDAHEHFIHKNNTITLTIDLNKESE